MTETIVVAVLSAVTGTFLPQLSQWLFGRRRLSAEAQSVEIDNAVKTVALVRKSLEDSERRLREANEIIDKLTQRCFSLEEQLRDQIRTNSELKAQHRELMKINESLIRKLEKNNTGESPRGQLATEAAITQS